MLEKNNQAPDFCLPDMDGREICLQDFRGRWVVMYFYPKDNTSGCTQEAIDFTAFIDDFRKMDGIVIGISPDSTKSHANFTGKYDLKVTLLSDPEHRVLEKYGVWQLKKMYGREYYGVARTTFLIDPEGKIAEVWEKVSVGGHAEAVKCQLEAFHQ